MWIYTVKIASSATSTVVVGWRPGKVICSPWSWACSGEMGVRSGGTIPYIHERAHVYTHMCRCILKIHSIGRVEGQARDKVTRTIMHQVFLWYGAGEILTDNGLKFRNELLTELCKLMGVTRAFTTSYQPRTNAVCERSHATVNSMLAKCIDDNHQD